MNNFQSTGPAPRGIAVAWARESNAADPAVAVAAMTTVSGRRQEGGVLRAEAANGNVVMQQLLGHRPTRSIAAMDLDGLVIAADCRLMHIKELADRLGLDPTSDDISLIAAAYRRWGPDLGTYLDGDYAIAIWDDACSQLTLLRDPFAMRPLFFASHQGLFLAASEIRMLHAAGLPAEVDELRLALQMCGPFGRIPHTYWLGTTALDQAETKVVGASSLRSFTHWKPQIGRPYLTSNELDALEGLTEAIKRSTAERVDPGKTALSLSGGVDSTNVAVAAPRGSLITLTHAYDDLVDYNERDVALLVARHIGARALEVPADDLQMYSCVLSSDAGGSEATYDAAFEYGRGEVSRRTMKWSRREGCHTLIIANRGDEMIGNDVWDLSGLLLSGRVARFNNELRALTAGQGLRRVLGELYCRLVAVPAFWRIGPKGWERAQRLFYGPQKWFTPPAHLPAKWHRQELADIIYGSATTRLSRGQGSSWVGVGSRARWHEMRSAPSARFAEIFERHGAVSGIEVTDPWADRRVAEFILKLPQWAVASPRRPKKLANVLATARCPLGTSPKINFLLSPSQLPSDGIRELATLRELAARDLCNPAVFKEILERQRRGFPDSFNLSFVLDAEYWLRCWAPTAGPS